MSWPILSVTTFLPLVGALLIMALPSDGRAEQRNARWIALWTTLVTFAISLILLYRFDPTSFEFQFVEKQPWLGGAITYHMGVDGIALPFVVLTTGLMPVCIIASWNPIQRVHDRISGARDVDGGHLRRARSRAVLCVL
jgi:NADH-quinone oxidoreductase subunit M